MVGEIRDEETAKIAVDSAETGHLVFSTLHTNSAAGAYPRLIDLGVNLKTMTSAINISLAQRLVRKLCPACRKEVALEGAMKSRVDTVVAGIVDRSIAEKLQTHKAWIPQGCVECNQTGYKGRIGIYEAILTDSILEATVEKNPSEREIKKATRAQGIPDMREDGIAKVLAGDTSLEELERVIDLSELE
jgi:type II secretory ATPase GspE/PulE/Tfp pilus assembly ATPase PilB-like protein